MLEMKLLVFAHTPPPYHGQSYMVKLMLDGLREGDAAVECYHVNCRFSDNMEDIGEIRFGKIWLLAQYCIQAILCRFRHGVKSFYYVPAPGKRAALYRDWFIMFLCRPFFKEVIFHWHAAGLGDWLHREGFWFEKILTRRLLRHPDLSIVLAISGMRDALWFETKKLEIVPNGIPDPCPQFAQEILPGRRSRTEARRKIQTGELSVQVENAGSGVFNVLYLAHCTRKKGLFDTLEAVAIANATPSSPVRVHLTVAGAFLDAGEEAEFQQRIRQADLEGSVTFAGFVSGEEKMKLLRSSDCLCFPTYYEAEGQPVSIIEAMAFGLPVIATRWRGIPAMLPANYPGFVPQQAPQDIAAMMKQLFTLDLTAMLRDRFTECFTGACYVRHMRNALQGVGR